MIGKGFSCESAMLLGAFALVSVVWFTSSEVCMGLGVMVSSPELVGIKFKVLVSLFDISVFNMNIRILI